MLLLYLEGFLKPGEYTLVMDITGGIRYGKIFLEGIPIVKHKTITIRDNVFYKLAICLTGKDAKISLLDFEIVRK